MKEIPLTQGKVAIVDDCDYEWLSQWKWQALRQKTEMGELWYATRGERFGPRAEDKKIRFRMHCEIARRGGLGPYSQIDHWDHDGLHNWRTNLRACEAVRNAHNRRKRINCSSRFKGVSLDKRSLKWVAYIFVERHQLYLGSFSVETEAAAAYAAAARHYFGEFACVEECSPWLVV